MAQIKKKDISDRILKEARREFLKRGFEKSSLREIASSSEVSLSNLYSYYSSKDALFSAVVASLKETLDAVAETFRTYQPDSAALDPLELEIERAKIAAKFIYDHRTDFHLLLNQSNGSSLEHFYEQLVQGYVINCKNFMSYLLENGYQIPTVPSDFFFATVARMFVIATKEAVRTKMPVDLIEKHAIELTIYNSFGFKGVSAKG